MGRIIFGKVETREVTFRSISPFPIDIELKPSILNGTGFSVSPTMFKDVPKGEELKLTFTFDVTKRSDDATGPVAFDIPMVLGPALGYSLHLIADLEVPTLNFSMMHFSFGQVIVGHTKIITLQLQNMNYVPCEFSFGEAQMTNVIQRQMAVGTDPVVVYTATPSSGVLPPSSFLNVEIAFEPAGDRTYSMQFPITVKHNPQPYYVTMRGTGVQLKVVFDQVGTPTYAYDLAAAIYEIVNERKYEGNDGVYHFSNEGVCSWFDFTKMIAEYAGHTACDIQPCHSDEFPSPVKRPSYSVLDKTKIKETFGIKVPYWTESLKVCLRNMGETK
jgi:hypothetical protein